MEADTGWTSPALLGNPFSSTTINDNFIIQDDDEMTILVRKQLLYSRRNFLTDYTLFRRKNPVDITWMVH